MSFQVAGKTPKSEEAIAALAEWEKLGRTTYTDPYDTPKADIVVDAIFGIGLERPLKDEFLDAAMWFNERRALHVSLDIPSGLNSETGTWGRRQSRVQSRCDDFFLKRQGRSLYRPWARCLRPRQNGKPRYFHSAHQNQPSGS